MSPGCSIAVPQKLVSKRRIPFLWPMVRLLPGRFSRCLERMYCAPLPMTANYPPPVTSQSMSVPMLTPAILKPRSSLLTLFVLILPVFLRAQSGAKNGEWPTYGGDLGNTRYSALDQIDASNFNKLKIAWSFKTDNLGPFPEYKFESTPLMVNGVLYTTAGSRRAVVALDPGTGEMLWMHSEHEGE